jgi:hypothetical protein
MTTTIQILSALLFYFSTIMAVIALRKLKEAPAYHVAKALVPRWASTGAAVLICSILYGISAIWMNFTATILFLLILAFPFFRIIIQTKMIEKRAPEISDIFKRRFRLTRTFSSIAITSLILMLVTQRCL